jgi:hypothetical protein
VRRIGVLMGFAESELARNFGSMSPRGFEARAVTIIVTPILSGLQSSLRADMIFREGQLFHFFGRPTLADQRHRPIRGKRLW